MFEKYSNKPDVNLVSSEFWKMVLIANWKNVIHDYEHDPIDRGKYLENAKAKIYLKYDYEQIKLFYIEYHNFYMKLYEYFEPLWLNKKYSFFMPSDDGYTDLISSIIGRGKNFTKLCIDSQEIFLKTAKNEDYIENFGYLLQVDENEYSEVRSKYDPLFRDTIKYNL